MHGGDAAQIDRHGLVQRQQLEALLVDVVLFLIDLRITGDDRAGQLHVALPQRAHRPVDRRLDQPGQGEQVLLQVIQVALQVFGHNSGQWSVVSGE